jgi:HAD superfamily hydrolase (TIGR01509 family)
VISTVLFDLGGTLWDDYDSERELWGYMREELAKLGIKQSDDEYKELMNRAIQSYAPSLTRAILWSAVKGDQELYQKVLRKILNRIKLSLSEGFHERTELFPGVRELLESLHGRYKLAVASNNFTLANGWLKGFGIDQYFDFVGLSEELWLFKPDARFYLHILEAVGADPRESVMVGDRLDNDIFPCNRLGMVTVRVLSPPWDRQQPRFHADVPDFTLDTVAKLPDVLVQMESGLPTKPHHA